jgi:hypothetical protein
MHEDVIAKQKALSAIKTANGGRCTAEAVVAEAANSASPLHGDFEWDDTKAGRLYRLQQARALIVRIGFYVETVTVDLGTITYTKETSEGVDPKTTDPAVHDPDLPSGVQGAVGISDIVQRGTDSKKGVIDREFSQVEAYLKRGLDWSARLEMLGYFIDRLEAMSAEFIQRARDAQQPPPPPTNP